MSQGYGLAAYAGWGEESVFNTPVAGAKWLEIMSENMKGSRKPIIQKSLGFRSNRRVAKGPTEVGGGFVFPCYYAGWENLLKHVCGLGSVASSGVGPYTHTFTLKQPLPVGLTVLINRDASNIGAGSMFQYSGCHINKFKLGQKIGEVMMGEVEFIGADRTNVNIQSPTFPGYLPVSYGQMTVANMDQTGSPYAMKIHEWSIEIDNKLQPNQRLTDHRSAGPHIVDTRMVNFGAQIEFENLTAYAAFRDATEYAYQFKFMLNSADSSVNTLQFDLPRAFIDEGEPETGGPGPYFVDLKGTALMNSADNDELSIVWKSGTASPI